MKLVMISLKDCGTQLFSRPSFVAHPNQALRNFMDEVNRVPTEGRPNDLYSHPADFELYEIGEFDDTDGSFSVPTVPKLLARAVDVFQGADSSPKLVKNA